MAKVYTTPFMNGTATEIVRQLHKGSRAPAATDQEFMEDVARRASLMSSLTVRTDSPDNFITDLIEHNMLAALVGN